MEMASPHLNDDDDEKPLDPAVESVRRKLIRFMAINLGVLLIALMAVVAAIVYKRSHKPAVPVPTGMTVPSPAEGAFLSGDIALPAGAKIVSQSLSGNRISIDVELADGSREILLFDIGERRIIGRFAVKPQ